MASAISGDQDDARAGLTFASTASTRLKDSAITAHHQQVDSVDVEVVEAAITAAAVAAAADRDASKDAQFPIRGDDALLIVAASPPPTTPPTTTTTTTTTSTATRRSPTTATTTGSTTTTTVTTPTSTAPIIASPPYWLNAHANARQRSSSNASSESGLPAGAITLRDNDTQDDDRNSACWAKCVEIVDHIVVNGSVPGLGAFVVWNIRVETLNGSFINIRKRYSEFDDFRRRLMATFPTFTAAVPELPPKSLIFRLRPQFLEKRRAGLQYFLNCILLNPEFSGSPVLKDFLFA